jgi:MFS transporter, putative metabolite:H+ symporter
MFFETIFIWDGAATAAYGVYLWGPTVIALLQKIPLRRPRNTSSS